MAYTRAADDFRAIRARMEELRRERERVDDAKASAQLLRLRVCHANSDPIIIYIGRPGNCAD
jgi:hypothetical protein